MRGFSTSLGVHCTFCHAEDPATHHPNFASDEKPTKDIARTMMLMTRDMNSKYLANLTVPEAGPEQREVTCGTCHRGMPVPEVFKPAGQPGPQPPTSAAPGQAPQQQPH